MSLSINFREYWPLRIICWGTSLQYMGPWWCPSENFGMVWIRWLDWWKHNKFTLDWWKEIFSSCYSHASRISFLLTDGSSYKGICATWSTFLLPPFVDPKVGDPPEMEKQSQRQGVKELMENNVRIKKAGGKTKLNFYFVPDRTGQAACRVSSSPSPFWKRLYLSGHSSSFGFHYNYKNTWTNYQSKTLKFLDDYKIVDTRKQPCPS